MARLPRRRAREPRPRPRDASALAGPAPVNDNVISLDAARAKRTGARFAFQVLASPADAVNAIGLIDDPAHPVCVHIAGAGGGDGFVMSRETARVLARELLEAADATIPAD